MVASRHLRLRLFAAHAALWVFLALVLFPLLMTVSISFRKGNFAGGSLLPTPSTVSLEHWRMVLGLTRDGASPEGTGGGGAPVLHWFWNSIKVSASAAALILLLSSTCAYAFARLPFRGRSQLLSSLLVLQMFPLVLALIAVYAILDAIGRICPAMGLDTHQGLILSYLGGIATHVWMIKGYFDSLPPSLEESAAIDGASPWQTFVRIVLPTAVPAFAVVFLLAFVGLMGEYPTASIVLQRTENWTLAVGAASFLYEQNYLWGDFAAAAILSGLPITILFLLGQKFLLSGLTAGAVKE